MLNFLSFAEFQIHTCHTQDVGNQNQGYTSYQTSSLPENSIC